MKTGVNGQHEKDSDLSFRPAGRRPGGGLGHCGIGGSVGIVRSDRNERIGRTYQYGYFPRPRRRHGGGSTILFNGGESESDLIAAGRVDNFAEYGVEDLFIASLDLTFTDMAEGGKFSILFGMESLRTGIGDAGTIQLLFEEEGGRIFFTAYEYLADDVFRILYDRRQVSGLAEGDTAALELFVNTQKQVTFIVDGDTLLDETQLRSNDGAGFVGLFSEGTNKLSVQNYSITAYTYDTPENPDYLETFDNDAYNANMFYSESKASPLSPSYLTAEDGQLVFSNTAGAFFSTRYQYSNFVLEFDITDLQRTAEKDAGGNITALISGWFGIGFGLNDYNEIADTTVQQGSWLQFEGTQDGADHTVPCASPRYILYDNDFASTGKYNPLVAQGMKFNPWSSEAEGKIINVRFSVLDGIVSLYLKYEGESWGTPELTYDMGYTPSGYVRIFQWERRARAPKASHTTRSATLRSTTSRSATPIMKT